MLTITSEKFSMPEDQGNGLLRLVCKLSGEELFVRRCYFYDATERRRLRFESTVQDEDTASDG